MQDNLHPAVALIIKRMQSHPEEFQSTKSREVGRWVGIIDRIRDYAVGADRDALHAAYSKVRLDELHEDVMDELLNGDERRAQWEREKQELATQRAAVYSQQAQSQIAQQQAAQMYNNQYANAIGVGAATPTTGLSINTLGNQSLNVGGETLTGDMLKKMKKALGL